MDEVTDQKIEDILNVSILEILNAQNLSEDEQKTLFEKMLGTIRLRALDAITQKLSAEDLETFKQIADGKPQEELDLFLEGKGMNLQDIMVEETIKYKVEVAELVENLKSGQKNLEEIRAAIDNKYQELK
jgi:hypothetical protein